ncbi:DNA primase [Phototrophicus methaneseepsis]|uniref:DNA primase n=1 Tax=Phototrophicus methaneseepsis TaxID=2710758 RepID=A0A7S8ED28_9CHLR|nr:DNA primase [Phototrophicus methaneseepsis]QPC84753.1 DNA primase [Phototrophicus methaneseepsis]
MSVTEQIKARLDIVQYVQQYVPQLKKAGRYYKACCPFHSEKTPSFVVNPDTQSWRCFGACAEGGDIFSFAMKQNGWSFSEALNELGRQAGVQVAQQTPEQEEEAAHQDRLRGMLQTAADFYHQHLVSIEDDATRAAYEYARQKRGFSDETIARYQIGYAPAGWQHMLTALTDLGYSEQEILDAGLASQNDRGRVYDRFRNRLMIPIKDDRGRMVGFGARALDPDDTPKYLNSPQTAVFDKSHTLFGLDLAKGAIRESETAVIVEGYMDVIQAHQAGYLNVIAQMGTAMTESQLRLIVPRYAKRIILALDADAAGQNATRRSLEVAREALQADYTGKLAVEIRVLHITNGKDPDDFLRETPEKWPEIVAAAVPVADFVIDLETAELGPDASLQERQAVAERVLPILSASENNLYTRENLQKLAMRLRISEQDLLNWAQELQREERKRRDAQARREQQQKSQPTTSPEDEPSSSYEPPIFFGDDDMPPMFDDDGRDFLPDVDLPAPAPKTSAAKTPAVPSSPAFTPARLTSRHTSRASEAHCLRMLLHKPDLLFQANRRLRELAQESMDLIDGPLGDITVEDFSQSDYRLIFKALLASLMQDDMEPLDYIRQNLDAALASELNQLLLTDVDMVQEQLAGRFGGEFIDSWGAFKRQSLPGIDVENDVVRRILQVRRQRVQREREEILFLVTEAERSHDKQVAREHGAQCMLLNMASHRLNQAILVSHRPGS